jgi:hypothetical protein
MVSLKKERLLGLIFTASAMALYLTISVFAIVIMAQFGLSASIENITLMVLQTAAFVLLLLGMILKKENLILGTLVAALVSSIVSYFVDDVSTVITTPIDFSNPWYLSSYSIITLAADSFLMLGAVAFLIYLLTGRHAHSRAWASAFFLAYLLAEGTALVFLIIVTCYDETYLLVVLVAGAGFLASLAYIVDINAYFFHVNSIALANRLPESKDERHARKQASNNAMAALNDVIVDYQNKILPSAFEEKNGKLILNVDLTSVPFYEDCSGGTLLNGAIYSFVEDIAFSLADGNALSLRFRFPEGTSEEEKKKIAAIFKAHYAIRYKNLREKLNKEMILAIIFVFVGFLLITFHLPYVSANSNSVYGEMLDIFGWVFTWEAVEILCVNAMDNQDELRRYRALYSASLAEEDTPEKV